MANNELAIRFTENNYATKQEVSKELKMSLIDNIWSNILSYRSNFNRYLSVRSIDRNQLLLCCCQTVTNKINIVETKLIKLMRDYMVSTSNPAKAKRFEEMELVKALEELVKEYKLSLDKNDLLNVTRGIIGPLDSSSKIISQYVDCLRYIKDRHVNPIDMDFLAELYSLLIGVKELTSFYRSKEDNNPENRVLIDRIYTCAPTNLIESMMNSLFSFLQTSNLSGLIKAIVTYYYINYIRPFPTHSDEIAVLMAKAVLAHNGLGEFGAFMPLEFLLTDNLELQAKIFVEVQKSNDVTYFVNYVLKVLEEKCVGLADDLVNLKAEELRSDFYRVEEEPKAQETISYQEPVKEQPRYEEPKPVFNPAPAPQPVVEEVKPVYQEPVREQPAPKVERVEQPKPVEKKPQAVRSQDEIAISYIPPVLDEKQAARLEEHLLESNVMMKKGEAHFYARHCTLGKSYTIEQYKKCIGCAYETARTSMEHLVEMGYYTKEKVNNKKFVYSPVRR